MIADPPARRPRRRLWLTGSRSLVFLSLLLVAIGVRSCFVEAGLFHRSYRVQGDILYADYFGLAISCGSVTIGQEEDFRRLRPGVTSLPDDLVPAGWRTALQRVRKREFIWLPAGFDLETLSSPTYGGATVSTHAWVTIPLWILCLILFIPSLIGLVRRRLALRRERNRTACAFCGYDLRMTPERCAECGALYAPPEDMAAWLGEQS